MEIPKVWTFDDPEVVKHFDDHVRASVPMYDEIQRMITELAQFYIRQGDAVLDLGCSIGTTLRNIDKAVMKDFVAIGIDDSEEMLRYCNSHVHLNSSTSWLHFDLNGDLQKLLGDRTDISFTIALLTLQFIKEENRQQLLNYVYNSTRKNGAIFIVEKVEGVNAKFQEMYTEFYSDMKVRNGLTAEQNMKKSKSLRGVMCPMTLAENIEMLHKAGFHTTEIIFKWYNFAGILATK